MGLVAAIVILSARTQENLESLLDRLKDDRVEVRDGAVDRLVQLFPAHEAALRDRAGTATDPEVRARLMGVVRAGELLVDRQEFSRTLSPRVHAAYPALAQELFSTDLDKRLGAFRTIARSATAPGPKDDPHRDFFMTREDCRTAVPFLTGLLQDGEMHEAIRLAWIDLVAQRPFLIAHPRVGRVTRPLFGDPSPKIRSEALQKLHATAAFDEEARVLLANVGTLDEHTLYFLDQAIPLRRIEEGYPHLENRLRLPEIGDRIARLILEHDIKPLIPAVLRAFDGGSRASGYPLDRLPREEVLRILLRKLDGSAEDRIYAHSCLDQLRIDDQGDRVALELSNDSWKVRGAALNYLQKFAYGNPRHAKAIARCLADFWDGKGIDPKNMGYVGSTAAGLLGACKATCEIEELIPRITDTRNFYQAFSMFRSLGPAGAAKRIVPLADADDPAMAGEVLKFLAEINAREEFLSRRETVLRMIREARTEQAWSSYGLHLTHAAARFGMRELVPLLMSWDKDERRRWVAASALGHLWTVEEKLKALECEDPWLRYLGIWSVAERGPEEACARLRTMDRHPDPEVRWAVAFSLSRFPAPECATLALRLSTDADPNVSSSAAWSFLGLKCHEREDGGFIYREDAGHGYTLDFNDGKNLLAHPNASIRLAAARGLTPELAREHPEILEPLLRDADLPVQKFAWDLYTTTLGETDPPLMARRFLEWRTDACELYFGLPRMAARVKPDVMAPLVYQFLQEVLSGKKAFKDRSFQHNHGSTVYDKAALVAAACQVLGTCGYREAEPTLLALLDSPDEALRRAALGGIGGLKSPKAVPKLIELLSTDLGQEAARALGETGIFPRGFLDPEQKALALRVLAVYTACDPAWFDAIAALISHPEWSVSSMAAESIGRLARSDDSARVLRLAYTPVPQLRAKLLVALRRFRAPELAGEVAGFLDDDDVVAYEAARFLSAQEVRVPLEKLSIDLRTAPVFVLEELLSVIGRSAARPLLPRILEQALATGTDRDYPTSVNAAKALARHGEPGILPDLIARLGGQVPYRRNLILPDLIRGYGPAAADYLRRELRAGDPSTKHISACALAEWRDRDAADDIECTLLYDLSGNDRGAAFQALVRLGSESSARLLLQTSADDRTTAVAARMGFVEAREEILERLRKPTAACVPLIQELNRAWSPDLCESALRWSREGGFVDSTGRVRLTFAPGVREAIPDRLLMTKGSIDVSIGEFATRLSVAPYPRWSFTVTPDGAVRMDEVDRVREAWIERLSNKKP